MKNVSLSLEELRILADKISLPLDENAEAVRLNVETWLQRANPFLEKMYNHKYDDIYPMDMVKLD